MRRLTEKLESDERWTDGRPVLVAVPVERMWPDELRASAHRVDDRGTPMTKARNGAAWASRAADALGDGDAFVLFITPGAVRFVPSVSGRWRPVTVVPAEVVSGVAVRSTRIEVEFTDGSSLPFALRRSTHADALAQVAARMWPPAATAPT